MRNLEFGNYGAAVGVIMSGEMGSRVRTHSTGIQPRCLPLSPPMPVASHSTSAQMSYTARTVSGVSAGIVAKRKVSSSAGVRRAQTFPVVWAATRVGVADGVYVAVGVPVGVGVAV